MPEPRFIHATYITPDNTTIKGYIRVDTIGRFFPHKTKPELTVIYFTDGQTVAVEESPAVIQELIRFERRN